MNSSLILRSAAIIVVLSAAASKSATAHDDPQAALAKLDDQTRGVADEAVQAALERRITGHVVAWEMPGVASGDVTPLRTWQSVTGHWCRQFEERLVLPSGEEHRGKAVSCRDGGMWRRSD